MYIYIVSLRSSHCGMRYLMLVALLTTFILPLGVIAAGSEGRQQDGYTRLVVRDTELNPAHLSRRDLENPRRSLYRRVPVKKAPPQRSDTTKLPSPGSRASPSPGSGARQPSPLRRESRSGSGSPLSSSGGLRRTDGHRVLPPDTGSRSVDRGPGKALGVSKGGLKKKSGSSSETKYVGVPIPSGGTMPASPFGRGPSTLSGSVASPPRSAFATTGPVLSKSGSDKMDWSAGGGGSEGGGSRRYSPEKGAGPPQPLKGASTYLAEELGKMTTKDSKPPGFQRRSN